MLKRTHHRGDAKILFRQGKYSESAAAGIQAARNLVGENFTLPRVAGHDDSVRCNLYELFNPHVRRYLMACCNGVAEALVHQNRLEEVSLKELYFGYLRYC